jgi:hypothetical protein
VADDGKQNGEKEVKPKKLKAKTTGALKKRDAAASLAPWKFPKNSLEDAIRVPKALDEKFAGNPTTAEDLVKAVGFNRVIDWRFQDLLKSAALYGMTSGSGATATVRMEKLGEDIIAPGVA